MRTPNRTLIWVLTMIVTGLLWACLAMLNLSIAVVGVSGFIGVVQPMWFVIAFTKTIEKRWLLVSGIALSTAIPYGAAVPVLEVACRISLGSQFNSEVCAGGTARLDYVALAAAWTLCTTFASLFYALLVGRKR